MADYIPRSMPAFNDWFNNLFDYVQSKTTGIQPAWTDIPQTILTDLDTAHDKWGTAYGATLVAHPTRPLLTERDDALKEAKAVIRPLVARFLHFPPRTNADRDRMGIPNRDRVPTPHIEVPELLEFEIDLRSIRELDVDFWVKGSSGKAKPTGYDGAVIVWQISDKPLIDPAKFGNHKMASRTPFTIKFDPTERGKTVYIAAVWQNARGYLGSWSDVQSAIVP